MRKSSSINALFPQIRLGILAATCMHPGRWWYLSDLAKHLQVRPSSLQRELSSLVSAGVLLRRRDGNRVYFKPDPECPFLEELQGLMLKTMGLVDVLREELTPLSPRIMWAFVYGSIARGEEISGPRNDCSTRSIPPSTRRRKLPRSSPKATISSMRSSSVKSYSS